MLRENIISLKDWCTKNNLTIMTGKTICRNQKVNLIRIDEEFYVERSRMEDAYGSELVRKEESVIRKRKAAKAAAEKRKLEREKKLKEALIQEMMKQKILAAGMLKMAEDDTNAGASVEGGTKTE